MSGAQSGTGALGVSNVDIRYVPLLWRFLDDDQIREDPSPNIISVTNEELRALLAADQDPNLPLPDDSLYHVLSYLTPCDLRAFSKILPHASQLHLNCNSNAKLMKATLSNSLNQLLKGSEVEFKCSSH